PNTIQERAVFKVESRTIAQVLNTANGVLPESAKLLQAFHFKVEGDIPKEGLDVSFPVDPASLQFPASENPEDAFLGLLVPQQVEDVTAYQFVDKLRYKDGKAFSNTKPIAGIAGMLLQGILDFDVTLALFGSKPVIVSGHAVDLVVPF